MSERSNLADIKGLIVTCTGCLCLVILVMGTLYGVIRGNISAAHLGSISGVGVGCGFLGLGYILYLVIKIAFSGGKKDE